MTIPSPETESASDRRLRRIDNKFYANFCRSEIGIILDCLLHNAVLADRDLVNAKLLQARERGDISREDYMDGLRPDIIARANGDTEHEGPLAVVEVSVTFNQGDLERAARRAAIIAGVMDNRVSAIVATHGNWPDDVSSLAQALGVTIVRHEDPDYSPYEDDPTG